MSEERVTIEIVDGVADVRLNRGDKMNAMDGPMFKALVETADGLAKTEGTARSDRDIITGTKRRGTRCTMDDRCIWNSKIWGWSIGLNSDT